MRYMQTYGAWIVVVALFVLTSCGAGSAGLSGAEPSFKEWVAQQNWSGGAAVDLYGMPAFPVETGSRSASATGDSITVLGSDAIQQRFAEIVGDALVIGPSPGGPGQNTAYGLYRFSGLQGMSPHTLTVNCIPNELEMKYFVGLADFTNMQWHWWGPVNIPEFQLNFENSARRFISDLGNMYMVVANHESNVARHESSTLTFGQAPPNDPTPPGAPSGLIASDGVFSTGIGLTWQPGAGAQWYRIFRKLPNGGGVEPEWQFIGESQTTEYFDATAVAGSLYYYKLNAARYGDNGQIVYSGWSNVDSGWVAQGGGSGTAPGAPVELQASDGTYPSIVRITWGAGDNAEWYRVFRKNQEPNGQPEWIFIGETEGLAWEDENVSPNVVYYYKAQSARVGEDGSILYSPWSNIDSGYCSGTGGGSNYSIVGTINDGYRAGTTVTIIGKGEVPITIPVAPGGSFGWDGLLAGDYVVYPYNPNHTFEPGFQGVHLGPDNQHVTLNFTGGPLTNAWRTWGFVYKYVANPGGNENGVYFVSGVTVKDRLDGSQEFRTGTTGLWGNYQIFENPNGLNILTPFADGLYFNPASGTVEVNGQQQPPARNFRAFLAL